MSILTWYVARVSLQFWRLQKETYIRDQELLNKEGDITIFIKPKKQSKSNNTSHEEIKSSQLPRQAQFLLLLQPPDCGQKATNVPEM